MAILYLRFWLVFKAKMVSKVAFLMFPAGAIESVNVDHRRNDTKPSPHGITQHSEKVGRDESGGRISDAFRHGFHCAICLERWSFLEASPCLIWPAQSVRFGWSQFWEKSPCYAAIKGVIFGAAKNDPIYPASTRFKKVGGRRPPTQSDQPTTLREGRAPRDQSISF